MNFITTGWTSELYNYRVGKLTLELQGGQVNFIISGWASEL